MGRITFLQGLQIHLFGVGRKLKFEKIFPKIGVE